MIQWLWGLEVKFHNITLFVEKDLMYVFISPFTIKAWIIHEVINFICILRYPKYIKYFKCIEQPCVALATNPKYLLIMKLLMKSSSSRQIYRAPKSHDILMFACLQKDAKQCCDATMPESIHIKDESKRGIAFALIFGVTWPLQWM